MKRRKFLQIWPATKLMSFEKDSQLPHANIGLFNFFKSKETSSTKFFKRSDVFYSILNEISQPEFPFTYKKHAADVLAHVVDFSCNNYYVSLKKLQWQILRKKIRRRRKWQSWLPHKVCNNIDMYLSLVA